MDQNLKIPNPEHSKSNPRLPVSGKSRNRISNVIFINCDYCLKILPEGYILKIVNIRRNSNTNPVPGLPKMSNLGLDLECSGFEVLRFVSKIRQGPSSIISDRGLFLFGNTGVRCRPFLARAVFCVYVSWVKEVIFSHFGTSTVGNC